MRKNFILSIIGILCITQINLAQTPATKKPASKVLPKPAQKKEAAPAEQPEKYDQGAMMRAWMNYMTPGDMHKMLAKSNGDWNEEVTMWMSPGTEPTKSTSHCINTMIMGDRYQESKHTGVMNGMQFEGTGIVGYDNAKKVFVSTWIDNMGTGIMYTEGKWNDADHSVIFTGKAVDPMTGKEKPVREVFKIIDDNNQTMEMYMTQNGNEFKAMEIKFTR